MSAKAAIPTIKTAYIKYKPDADFPDLSKSNSHMSTVLKENPSLYTKYRNVVTPTGYTFDNAIQTGVDNPSHPYIKTVGATAGDEETYTVFKDFFDKVIYYRHNGYPADGKHKTDLKWENLKDAEFNEKYVLTARVRTGRCVRGIALPTHCTRAERNKVEEIIKKATAAMGEEEKSLNGTYEGLYDMTEKRHEELIEKHLMFEKPVSPLLIASGMARDWPSGRGVYLAEDERFIVWVNEEDHMRIVSMQKGGNMKEVFERFCKACTLIEKHMKAQGFEYMWNEHLGYVLTCPSNLGTGIRAGCHVKVPLLTAHKNFTTILSNLRLQKRGTGGVDTKGSGGTWDISNNDRLGFSELELVQMVVNGINMMCAMEEKLEKGETIDDMIPKPIDTPWGGMKA